MKPKRRATYHGIPPIILLIIGALSIVLFWRWYVDTEATFEKHIALIDSLKEARADVTKAYLLAEKYWADKETIQRGSIIVLLENGLFKIKECLTNRSRFTGASSPAVTEEPLRTQIAEYEVSVSAFRSALLQSLERNDSSARRFGSERALFYSMELRADQLMATLDQALANSKERTRSRFLLTLSSWVALLIGAFVVLFFLERRQRRQAETLQYQNYLVNNVSDAIIATNGSMAITLWNDAAEELYGWSEEEVRGKRFNDVVLPGREAASGLGLQTMTRSGEAFLGEVVHQRRDGSTIPIETKIHEISASEPEQKAFVMVNRDISGRKRMEEERLEQAVILDAAEDAIFLRDLQNRIRSWNKGAEHIYGWKAGEVMDKDAADILYEGRKEELQRIRTELDTKGTYEGEIRQYHRTGKELTISVRLTMMKDLNGNPKSILTVNRDITERKQIENQLLRTQRLESIGTLAGGIAHDLNNVLGPILLSIEVLRRKITDQSLKNILGTLETSAKRGADLIRQVLSFARGAEGERTAVQLRHLIREVERFARDTFPKSIRFESIVPRDLWTVNGDATQLHQVIMNLCVNARDAMPAGGALQLRADNATLDDQYTRSNAEATVNDYVVLQITDSGVGIPTEIREKIFEPFFTTKEHGKGTGIGLSTVHTIVKMHKGFITVSSEPGKGSTFKVHLPAQRQDAVSARAPSQNLPAGRGETVLIVDDETGVRQITQSTLETFGYRVFTASDGAEAVSRFAEHRNEIDLVLTDVMMPYMDGTSAARSLRKIKPDLKIILVSGLERSEKLPADISNVAFLQKPYTSGTLLSVIRNVLDSKESTPAK